jgi:hypothetical protein
MALKVFELLITLSHNEMELSKLMLQEFLVQLQTPGTLAILITRNGILIVSFLGVLEDDVLAMLSTMTFLVHQSMAE